MRMEHLVVNFGAQVLNCPIANHSREMSMLLSYLLLYVFSMTR